MLKEDGLKDWEEVTKIILLVRKREASTYSSESATDNDGGVGS